MLFSTTPQMVLLRKTLKFLRRSAHKCVQCFTLNNVLSKAYMRYFWREKCIKHTFNFHVKFYSNIYIIDKQVMVVSCLRSIYVFVLLLNFCKAMPYMRMYLWRIHTVVFSDRPCSCCGLVDGWYSAATCRTASVGPLNCRCQYLHLAVFTCKKYIVVQFVTLQMLSSQKSWPSRNKPWHA